MAEADREKWEARYAAGTHAEVEPEPLLLDALAFARPGGPALDVACGRGRHAIALARAGHAPVDAVDISPRALASGQERAGDLDAIRWIEADLDRWRPEPGAYDVVVCVDFTHAALAASLVEALAPGGVLAFLARPRARCSHGPEAGAVGRWFAVLEALIHREDEERIAFVGRRG